MACHGDDLAGQIEFEDPTVGHIANANLALPAVAATERIRQSLSIC
jgi:hypothetical protein